MIDSTATSSLQMQVLEANQNLLEQRFEMNNEVNDRISSQISSSTYTLEIISVGVTIAGLFLAWHINNSYEKINKIRKEINSTKKYVDKHNDQLYERLKRNDTLDILSRLIAVPEDIHNVIQLLFSRHLKSEDFFLLKKAYMSENLNGAYKREYILVFQQHFPYQSIKDVDMQLPFLESLKDITSMFVVDVQNLFDGVIRFLKENNCDEGVKGNIIKNLFLGLHASQHRELIFDLKQKFSDRGFDIPEVVTIALSGTVGQNFIDWINQ